MGRYCGEIESAVVLLLYNLVGSCANFHIRPLSIAGYVQNDIKDDELTDKMHVAWAHLVNFKTQGPTVSSLSALLFQMSCSI